MQLLQALGTFQLRGRYIAAFTVFHSGCRYGGGQAGSGSWSGDGWASVGSEGVMERERVEASERAEV